MEGPTEFSLPPEVQKNESHVKMILDVDQVLADMMLGHIHAYNERLTLGMSEEEMTEDSKKYRQTFDVPAIKAAKEQDLDSFNKARGEILNDVELHQHFPAIADAQQGVTLLQTLISKAQGNFEGYFTARPEAVGETTAEWLQTNNFPEAPVVVCKDSKDKLIKIINHFQLMNEDTDIEILLIDDSIGNLVKKAKELSEENPAYKKALARITIAAYSYNTQDAAPMNLESDLNVISLESWTIPGFEYPKEMQDVV